MTTAERLKTWRKANQLTQENAARRLGVTVSAYCRWESGKANPRGLSVVAIERALEAAMANITKATGIKPE